MKDITEAMGVHEQWYEDAKRVQTPADLLVFVEKLTTEYAHDYGTICHAITAAAIAAGKTVDRSPSGGITGFQASAVMWEFIRHWMHYEGPMRLLEFGDMLYPQYEEKFAKTISPSTWRWIQEEAKKVRETNSCMAEEVAKHHDRIIAGEVPFGYEVKGDDEID